jgi:lysophospholipase L1-like esterase
MPDTKISALASGTTPQDTDEFPIRRSTGNNKLTWAQMRAAVSGAGVLSSTIICHGDSITNSGTQAGLWDYIAGTSGGRLRVLRNSGVNGNTTTQMAARFAADVVAYAPDYVAIMGHVNDPTNSAATVVANYTAMVAAARSAGIIPIIVAAPPYNSQPASLQDANRKLWRLAQTLEVQFIDPWIDCIEASTGGWRSGYSSDGTHPTQTSYRLAAIRALEQFTLPTYRVVLPTYADPANKISNGLLLSGTTGWGSVQTGLTLSTSSASLPTLGSWLDVAIAGVTPGSFPYALGTISYSGLAVGDTLAFVGRMKTVGFEANGNGTDAGKGKCAAYLAINLLGAGVPQYLCPPVGADVDLWCCNVFTVPAGTTGMSLLLSVGNQGASGNVSGTLSFAQLGLFKLN